MFHGVIKKLEEKQVVIEIDLMVWSDRLDLVAFSNTKGELALHRITWTKAWSLAPPREGSLITALAWRPDGKIIAAAYDTKELVLINVENKKILHSIITDVGITCILWAQEKNNGTMLQDEYASIFTQYVDESNNFIADPPALSNYSTNIADYSRANNFFQLQSELNLLFMGSDTGSVLFNIFGSLPCIEIDVTSYLQKKASPFEQISCQIIKLHLTDDLSRLFVTLKDSENDLKMVILNTQIFNSHSAEIFAVSMRQEKINGLIKYLDTTLTTLEEIWEGVLLEMDEKLSNYASRLPEGMLSVEFLDLLMFGIYSPEMDAFLLNELTIKGLEKFGISLETSYANMQALLFNHLTKAARNIYYHLNDLQGFSRLEHRFKDLGLNEEIMIAGIEAVGSLLLKSGEMLHILDDTLVNSRAFIRWLTMATLYIMDESIPSELQKRSQTDILCIAEFVKNFDNISGVNNTAIGGKKQQGFILERLGQYLSDAPLTIITDFSTNTWDNFLKKNDCIQNNASIIKHMPDLSLIQQHSILKRAISSMHEDTTNIFMHQINAVRTIYCCRLGEIHKPLENKHLHITQINCGRNLVLHAFVIEKESDGLYLIETNVKNITNITAQAVHLYIANSMETSQHLYTARDMNLLDNINTIIDVGFYNSCILTLLLRKQDTHRSVGVLCQLHIFKQTQEKFGVTLDLTKEGLAITEQNIVRVNITELSRDDVSCHMVDMVPLSLAVSGARKVAIVLATNQRTVRIYEMEADDDDDDDDDDNDEDEHNHENKGHAVDIEGAGLNVAQLENDAIEAAVDCGKEMGDDFVVQNVKTEIKMEDNEDD